MVYYSMTTASPPDKTKPHKNRLVKNRLAALRLQANLTQVELAQRLEIQQHSICNMENGQQAISDKIARRLCVALGCSPFDLLYIDPLPAK